MLSDSVFDKILTGSVKDLVSMLERASSAYYFTDSPLISDVQFDMAVSVLENRSPKNKFLTTVGASPESGDDVRLPIYMGSLDKIKPNIAGRWLIKKPGPYVVSDKMDGMGVCLTFIKGNVRMWRRGDGTFGKEITKIAKLLNLPKVSQDLTVRAELELSNEAFVPYSGDFVTPRALVGGVINSDNPDKTLVSKLTLFCFEIIGLSLKKSEQLRELKRLGFTVPKHKIFSELDVKKLSEIYASRVALKDFDRDGIVIDQDTVVPRVTSGNPVYSVAFKVVSHDGAVEATVTGIEWNPSKRGYIVPRLMLEPVKVGGVTVRYTNGFNAKFVFDNNIGVGSVLKLVRSGDVIPHIVGIVRETKPLMPVDVDYRWTDSGVDIVLVGTSNDVIVKKMRYFFTVLGIEDIGPVLLGKMVDSGFSTIHSICTADVESLMALDGVQHRLASKIVANIRKGLSAVKLSVLMDASGLFGSALAGKRLSEILNTVPNIVDIACNCNTDKKKKELFDAVCSVSGISEKLAIQFINNLPAFLLFLADMPVTIISEGGGIRSTAFSQYTVVFTGFRDKDLSAKIVDGGGTVVSRITKAVNLVIAKDPSKNSDKLTEARERGVEIMTPEAFLKLNSGS